MAGVAIGKPSMAWRTRKMTTAVIRGFIVRQPRKRLANAPYTILDKQLRSIMTAPGQLRRVVRQCARSGERPGPMQRNEPDIFQRLRVVHG